MADEAGGGSRKSDLFISYAREDAAAAKDLAERLRQRGIDVWWDARLDAGASFHRDIAAVLAGAKLVVVLWSRASIESTFVLDEAGRARDAGKLVPVRLADVTIPLGFGALHTPDLFSPSGETDEARIDDLLTSIERRLREGAPAATPPSSRRRAATPGPAATRPGGGRPRWLLGAIVAVAAAAIAIVVIARKPKPPPTCPPISDRALEFTDKALEVASSGNYQRGLLFLDQAISADERYEPAYLWRARSYLNTGQPARAVVDLDHLLRPPCCNDRVCDEARELLASLKTTGPAPRPDAAGAPGPAHDALIRQMFGDDKERRIAATSALVAQLPRDPQIVADAVAAARAQPNNGSGVINTLVVLQAAPEATIRANRNEIAPLLGEVRDKGPLTTSRVGKLEQTHPVLRTAPRERDAATYKIALAEIRVLQNSLADNADWRNGVEWAFEITISDARRALKVLSVPATRYRLRTVFHPRNVGTTVESSGSAALTVSVKGTRGKDTVDGPRVGIQGQARWEGTRELRVPVRASSPRAASFELVFQIEKQRAATPEHR